jgi:hypothetical protein
MAVGVATKRTGMLPNNRVGKSGVKRLLLTTLQRGHFVRLKRMGGPSSKITKPRACAAATIAFYTAFLEAFREFDPRAVVAIL